MSIAKELERLTSLRNRGDLTQAEFDQARELLQSGDTKEAPLATETKPLPSSSAGRPKQYLLIAILSTIAAAFSAGSAILDPSLISMLALALFTIASVLNWLEFSKHYLRK